MGFTSGIVGLPNAGKSTLFNLVTKANALAESYPFCTIDPNIGIVNVPDDNLQKIAHIVKPEKITPTILKLFDIAGLVKNAHKGEGLGNQFLGHIRGVDAIIHVVRCFRDPNISHIYNEINPVVDMEIVLTELVMADLDIVSKRIESMEKAYKGGKKELQAEIELMHTLKDVLAQGQCIIDTHIEFDQNYMKSQGILTAKPYVVVANISEDEVSGSQPLDALRDWGKTRSVPVISVCTKFELEASELDEIDRQEFLTSVGISQLGVHTLISSCYQLLQLITFYTTVGKELRAWTLKRGGTLHDAAGLIHTDIQEGFIKAEVVACNDFITYGGMHGAREAGLVLIEGKSFIVRDKDIVLLHFR